MRIMLKKIYIALFLVALFSCRETDSPPLPITLPALTEQGLGTFGCFIDNELFIPEFRQARLDDPFNQDDRNRNFFPAIPVIHF